MTGLFDLAAGPLFRARLLLLETTRRGSSSLSTTASSTAWSAGIFVRELGCLLAGESLPGPALEYADYAAWQRNAFGGDQPSMSWSIGGASWKAPRRCSRCPPTGRPGGGAHVRWRPSERARAGVGRAAGRHPGPQRSPASRARCGARKPGLAGCCSAAAVFQVISLANRPRPSRGGAGAGARSLLQPLRSSRRRAALRVYDAELSGGVSANSPRLSSSSPSEPLCPADRQRRAAPAWHHRHGQSRSGPGAGQHGGSSGAAARRKGGRMRPRVVAHRSAPMALAMADRAGGRRAQVFDPSTGRTTILDAAPPRGDRLPAAGCAPPWKRPWPASSSARRFAGRP